MTVDVCSARDRLLQAARGARAVRRRGRGDLRLFKALGDPARVKILNLLATSDEPICACELIPALGLSQPTVSHHLKKLTDAGLLRREQRGVWAYYSIDPEAVAQLGALADLTEERR